MERLTERTTDGILVKENHVENGLRTFYQCFGEKPNDKYTNCDGGYCAIEKLAAYEDAEGQGLLLRMPRDRDCFCGCQSVKIHQCILSSIVVEKTKIICLECVLEDFARIVVIRRTAYVRV